LLGEKGTSAAEPQHCLSKALPHFLVFFKAFDKHVLRFHHPSWPQGLHRHYKKTNRELRHPHTFFFTHGGVFSIYFIVAMSAL